MIYTPKKNPKNLNFFVEKSEILGGFYLQHFFLKIPPFFEKKILVPIRPNIAFKPM